MLTGYSYLTPSLVEVTQPAAVGPGSNITYFGSGYSIQAGQAKYIYRAFSDDTGSPVSINPTKVMSETYLSFANHEKVFLSILRNSTANKEYEDTQDIAPIKIHYNESEMVYREMYKDLFSDIGFTLDKRSDYDQFYDRPPGAFSPTPTDVPEPTDVKYNELFGDQEDPHGLGFDHYSDGNERTDKYYRKYMLNNKQIYFDNFLASPNKTFSTTHQCGPTTPVE